MRLPHHHLTSLLMLALLAPLTFAAERPTFNKDTCDPRPDILPYWLTDWHQDYRREFNRPRYFSGKIAHAIEPTSQEAMVWCEANQLGLYNGKDCPPMYKQYYYPKPWELLQTGPRADFKKPNKLEAGTVSNASSRANSTDTVSPEQSPSDQPSSQSTPSDASSRNVEATDKADKPTSFVKPARAFHFQ